MTTAVLYPFRPLRKQHVALVRHIAAVQHGLLDQSTFLGYLWSFLNPLLMLLVLYAFFSAQIGAGIEHYGIFLLIGLVQFAHFSKSTASAMRVLHRMGSLCTSVIFPKELLVYSSLLADLPEFLISMAATLVLALVTGVPASWALAAIPLIVALQLLLVVWVSFLLAIMYVFVRDLDHIFEVGMRLLFFVTPIVYGPSFLSARLQRIALLSPLARLLGYARGAILGGHLPPAGELLAFLGANCLLAYGFVLLFRRLEPALMERL